MTDFEAPEMATESLRDTFLRAAIAVGIAVNLGFVGAFSSILFAGLIGTGIGLGAWLLAQYVPNWVLGLLVFARAKQCKSSASTATATAVAGCTAALDCVEVTKEDLIDFEPANAYLSSPSDILSIVDPDEIYRFALEYNKVSPEVACKNLRYVVRTWRVKPQTKAIWIDVIKKIEFHNDGQAMADIFFGGELPEVQYFHSQGQPVACWEDSVKLPSQLSQMPAGRAQ